jgi:hypothetical protein
MKSSKLNFSKKPIEKANKECDAKLSDFFYFEAKKCLFIWPQTKTYLKLNLTLYFLYLGYLRHCVRAGW